jgi:hypothetical protein
MVQTQVFRIGDESELWFHGTVEHVEPQFVNLSLSNNASQLP